MKITTNVEIQKVSERKLNQRAFLIFEGHRTEVKYFKTLADMRATARLSDNVEIVVLDRFEHDSGLSDPLHILELTERYIKFLETGRMTPRLFAGYCVDCAGIQNKFNMFYSKLDALLGEKSLIEGETINNIPEAEKVAKLVLSDFGYEDVDLNFDRVDYDERCDTVNIIIDRDKSKSRPDEKYRMFLERCEALKYVPYVTNPKFELWLLCHYDGAQEALKSISEIPFCVVMGLMGRKVIDMPISRPVDQALTSYDLVQKNGRIEHPRVIHPNSRNLLTRLLFLDTRVRAH